MNTIEIDLDEDIEDLVIKSYIENTLSKESIDVFDNYYSNNRNNYEAVYRAILNEALVSIIKGVVDEHQRSS